jgi:aminoglycoside phosphotransferase (APT) family kinase protein
MASIDMPAAEVEVTIDQVEALLADQYPELARAHVTDLAHGWDNILFLIDRTWLARFPRRQMSVGLIGNERRWLPRLAPLLPLPIPAPIFVGEPGHGYPWPWLITRWIPGESAATAPVVDREECARQLGGFLFALHRPAPAEAPRNPFRGIPLHERDTATRQRISRLGDSVDPVLLGARWAAALSAARFDSDPVWLHGDLHPNNLICEGGRLAGVVDFGDITSGDPATDLAVAWMMFPLELHSVFRNAYGDVDWDTWERARGWALSLGLAYLANSADNPIMRRLGERTIGAVLADHPS